MNEYRKAKRSSIVTILDEALEAINQLEKIFLERTIEQLKGVEILAKVKKNNGKASTDRA